ncbi:unnamed protein product [Schistocephalus solidus]|uniref:Peptidase A2 domain-containing protein n=1 Tax=Schistocephalus solidus TaxID=70667 RepID=A0A183T490_SCHSO|nr:unnamed protein product [Schistocephalus solidus]
MAMTAAGQSRPSRLYCITDKSSGLRFLVDTGAETFVESLAAPLPTIWGRTGAVLKTLAFTLWDVTVAVHRLCHCHSPGQDGVPISIIKADVDDILPSLL